MPVANPCKAIVHGDQMTCSYCRFVWDLNDPDPPKCISDGHCSNCESKLLPEELEFLKENSEVWPPVCAPCYRKSH